MNDRTTSEMTRPAGLAANDDAAPLTRYVGGKNGSGCFQRLISLIPPHRVRVEAFGGSAAISRRIRPALRNVVLDVDAGVIRRHAAHTRAGWELVHADALAWLRSAPVEADWFIYCDPPYLGSARRQNRKLYACEMLSALAHARLLRLLCRLPAMVMISGYPSALYDRYLAGWNRIEYQANTRRGLVPEVAWFNYPHPSLLHDYRFLGRDFHDRCRIQRKIKRWTAKLAALPALERAAILDALAPIARNAAFDDARD
jgi:hypothetical protein